MKKIAFLATAALAALTTVASAQLSKTRTIDIINYEASVDGNNLNVNMDLGYHKLIVAKNDMLVVTPLIVKGRDTLALRPVVFAGKTRLDVRHRADRLNNTREVNLNPYQTVVFGLRESQLRKMALKRGSDFTMAGSDVIRYNVSVPYRSDMDGSMLVLQEKWYGCNRLFETDSRLLGRLQEPVDPRIIFIVPEYEVEKRRSEKMTAYINFKVAQFDIIRNFDNNAAELDRVYAFYNRIKGNTDLEIGSVDMIGYASPEGRYSYNDRLSMNRVNSLKSHLRDRLGISERMFNATNVPEDWDSLRRWVAQSTIRFKSDLLDIIDTTSDPDARDAKIRALDNGSTYNMLLKDVYPGLRRVDLTINYVVKPFTVEKGKEVIRTNPRHLSLHEFYMIAESYPADSQQYKDVFATAATYYPNDPVANNNMAAIALRDRDLAAARRHLERISDYAGAQNNLGVLNALEGNFDQAERWFNMAVDSGSAEARYNLQNLRRLK